MANTKRKKLEGCTAEESLIIRMSLSSFKGNYVGPRESVEVYNEVANFYDDFFGEGVMISIRPEPSSLAHIPASSLGITPDYLTL